MKSVLIAVFIVICFGATVVRAQNNTKQAESVEDLKLQLIDLSANEEAAKLRAEQLDEALKPENIERSLAGYGSTHPEELREQRRRQLTIEKTAVTATLEQLALKRSRLESAISTAEVQAYQQSASGEQPFGNYFGIATVKSMWLPVMLLAAFLSIGGVVAGVFVLRKILK